MFKIIFNSRWPVPFVLSLMAFALAAIVFFGASQDEADKARALKQGPPAAASLNTFDPKRDIHPMNEVTVTGWINADYNYQLTLTTKTKSSSYDTVRRMFVLFGPEDTAETKTARAVVLLPDADVDRFIDGLMTNTAGFAAGNPVFSLNGTATTGADLGDMAADALRKQGLTKAPGFRFIKIWPVEGRAEALAPDPDQPLQLAAFPGVPGLILFLIAAIKFTRRNRVAPVSQTLAHLAQMQAAASMASPAQAPSFGTLPPGMPDPALVIPKGTRWPFPRPSSRWFLFIAVGIYALSTWVGGGLLMMLAFAMAVAHFLMRGLQKADVGVAGFATIVIAFKAKAQSGLSVDLGGFQSRSATDLAAGIQPISATDKAVDPVIARMPSLVERVMALGAGASSSASSSGGGGTKALRGLHVIILIGLCVLFFKGDIAPFLDRAIKDQTDGPAVMAIPEKVEPVSAPAVPALDVEPVTEAVVVQPEAAAAIPAPVPPKTENPIIPAAASLRSATPDPVASPEDLTAVEPAAATAAPLVASAATDEEAATTEIVPSRTVATGSSLFGGLPMLLALAAFALLAAGAFALKTMRASVPAKVLAGKDPWANLAREARGSV